MGLLPTTHADGTNEIIHASTINDIATAINRMAEVSFNVKDYGAVGDGNVSNATANTTGIQAAINAASAAGGARVVFGPGTYNINAQLTVPSFVTLEGPDLPYRAPEYGIIPAALGAMILGPATTTFDMIQNSDTTNGNTGITIRNLWIGVGATTVADVSAVVFNKVRRSLLENCYLRGQATTSRYGLRYTGISEHCTVRHCWFEGCGIVTGVSANALRVIDTEFAQGGIQIFGGFSHIIRGCDIYQDGVGPGVAYPAYPYGILLADCTEALVVNNQIAATREHGIYLKQGAVSCLVDGNTVVNSSQETSGVWSGITLDSASAAHATIDNVVTNNRCYNRGGVTQAYGIVVTSGSGTQTNNNLIANNNVRSNATGGVQIATSGLTNTYRSNIGFVTEATGSASKQNTNTITHGLATTPTSVQANSAVARHFVTITAVGATTFTIGLTDDAGTAIAVNETIYWSATYVPA